MAEKSELPKITGVAGDIAVEDVLRDYAKLDGLGAPHPSRAMDYYAGLADHAAAGMSTETLRMTREQYGVGATYRELVEIGKTFEIPQDGRAAGAVAEAVRARLELKALYKDPEFSAKLLAGDPHAREVELDLTLRGNPRALEREER